MALLLQHGRQRKGNTASSYSAWTCTPTCGVVRRRFCGGWPCVACNIDPRHWKLERCRLGRADLVASLHEAVWLRERLRNEPLRLSQAGQRVLRSLRVSKQARRGKMLQQLRAAAATAHATATAAAAARADAAAAVAAVREAAGVARVQRALSRARPAAHQTD